MSSTCPFVSVKIIAEREKGNFKLKKDVDKMNMETEAQMSLWVVDNSTNSSEIQTPSAVIVIPEKHQTPHRKIIVCMKDLVYETAAVGCIHTPPLSLVYRRNGFAFNVICFSRAFKSGGTGHGFNFTSGAMDSLGRLWLVASNASCIFCLSWEKKNKDGTDDDDDRKVDPTLSIVAGSLETRGYADHIDPLQARFGFLEHIAIDLEYNHVFISDIRNNCIRRMDGGTGAVSTWVGKPNLNRVCHNPRSLVFESVSRSLIVNEGRQLHIVSDRDGRVEIFTPQLHGEGLFFDWFESKTNQLYGHVYNLFLEPPQPSLVPSGSLFAALGRKRPSNSLESKGENDARFHPPLCNWPPGIAEIVEEYARPFLPSTILIVMEGFISRATLQFPL